eukprot:UN08033
MNSVVIYGLQQYFTRNISIEVISTCVSSGINPIIV